MPTAANRPDLHNIQNTSNMLLQNKISSLNQKPWILNEEIKKTSSSKSLSKKDETLLSNKKGQILRNVDP